MKDISRKSGKDVTRKYQNGSQTTFLGPLIQTLPIPTEIHRTILIFV